MIRRIVTSAAVVAATLLTGGCLGLPDAEPEPATATTTKAASPSPTGTPAQALLVEALRRVQQVAYRFSVQGDLPDDGGTITANGAYDPAAKLFESTIQTAATKGPVHRIVVGTDNYLQQPGGGKWVHLDLKRVKTDSLVYFDMTDPTGLVQFTTKVGQATLKSAGTYTGTFNASGAKPEFLPVGAPSIWSIGGENSPFTISVDEQGWVTSIAVELTGKDKTLKLVTTLSGHNTPTQIKAPAKKSVVEADDMYYG
ncbi:hypothetical protein AB0J72_50395 [Dactylosporangium sp. NPDC049742]|uniref:hypothetical protein n=1 Tax=Dactylosporangium sp. NPDC049742 TaxID=3154737 RepID=UPI003442ABBC